MHVFLSAIEISSAVVLLRDFNGKFEESVTEEQQPNCS